MMVVPSASTAAITIFSVAVTLASSSRISAPLSRPRADFYMRFTGFQFRTQRLEAQQVRVDSSSPDAVSAGEGQPYPTAAD